MIAQVILVGAGGFLGAAARWAASTALHRWLGTAFPYGTLAVNVVGCFVIGLLMHAGPGRAPLAPTARLFFIVGILGGFTTFSSFGYETIELLRGGQTGLALGNVAANALLGLGAVWLGQAAVKLV